MAAPKSVPELLEFVRKSTLLEPARLAAYLVTNPGPFDTPRALVAKMTADGLLSPFHAEQLMRGKYRGFFLGKYKILDRIGMGGMGQVFLAEHVGMRRRVALKVLPPDRATNEFSRERFLREARAAGQLDHPNLVRAFDVDGDGDVTYLAMEFVDGVTFHDLVARSGPVNAARGAYFLWQAAHGLGYMSARGLIHRDIKPANLLLDRQGVVKILDLGLVRSEEEGDELTRGEGVKLLGTADYLAPEQAINCSTVDTRADVYSLGAVGYYLFTGRPPFECEKMSQKLIAHQIQEIRPLHEIRPDIPHELSAVVARMLAKKPEYRYQTAADLAVALQKWAQNPPPPPTDQEIPALTGAFGSPTTVSLSSQSSKSTRSSESSASGSAIGLQQDSNFAGRISPSEAVVRTPSFPMMVRTPAPGGAGIPAPAPPPETPNGLSQTLVTPIPQPAPFAAAPASSRKVRPVKLSGTRFSIPSLPADASHGPPVAAPPVEAPTFFTRPDLAAPAEAGSRSKWGRRVTLALAFGLVLAIAVWDVAVLTGAVTTRQPVSPPAAPGADARDGADRASAPSPTPAPAPRAPATGTAR